ncbi:hypothetical protein HH219_00020 [Pseudoalteromonas sp. NEC-BIFX-2020_015]|uniref:hypothetical protein n=1 Tax=Pseudoalteromonas sp. NEC-BIFX-2020_015 TaxID=2729544 RepID=UPI0014613BBA|nr:hypothetical protein [Pseudoalteromonas sp. NEC-BIFX-2020_015]NMR23942.1 hypothetical protein [Pseudoalteromonas sp. NEC-BIFX-2020_015]
MKKLPLIFGLLVLSATASANQNTDEAANLPLEQLTQCLTLVGENKQQCLSQLINGLSLTNEQQESFFAFAKANGLTEDELLVYASANPNLNLELISSGTAAGGQNTTGINSGTGTPLASATGSGSGGGGSTVSDN